MAEDRDRMHVFVMRDSKVPLTGEEVEYLQDLVEKMKARAMADHENELRVRRIEREWRAKEAAQADGTPGTDGK